MEEPTTTQLPINCWKRELTIDEKNLLIVEIDRLKNSIDCLDQPDLDLINSLESGESGYLLYEAKAFLDFVKPEEAHTHEELLKEWRKPESQDLRGLRIKYACPLCHQQPDAEYKGLYKAAVCKQPGEYLFCGYCLEKFDPELDVCPLGCGKHWNRKATRFAPYPAELWKVLVHEKQIRDKYKNSAGCRRNERYPVLRAKRDVPVVVTKKEMRADIRNRDEEDKNDQHRERIWQQKLVECPWMYDVSLEMFEGLEQAFKKYREWRKAQKIKNKTIDIIQHFDSTNFARVVYPFICIFPKCELQFKQLKDLKIHQRQKHPQHTFFKYRCFRPYCEFQTDIKCNFKRHELTLTEDKDHRKCPQPRSAKMRELWLTCLQCNYTFLKHKTRLNHEIRGCKGKKSGQALRHERARQAKQV